jgi:hypothetical protein
MHKESLPATAGTRRDFLKIAAGGLASVTAAGALAACSASPSAGNGGTQAGPASFDSTTDVLVLGGGSGGAFAAYFAMDGGKKVTVIEASPTLGGTLLSAGGGFHTWNLHDPKEAAQKLPYADPALLQLFMETFNELREWMVDNVPNCSALNTPNPVYADIVDGVMMGPGAKEKVEAMEFLVDGAEVRLNTWARSLICDDQGKVIGAVVEDSSGKLSRIGAQSTIIATGSYPANKEMVVRSLGRWADKASIRATPYNTGAGIKMGEDAGALLSMGAGHFYGHMVPYPPLFPQNIGEYEDADIDAARAILSPVQSLDVEGLAVNTKGLRYSDESFAPFVGDNYLANDTSQQEGAHAFIIIDSAKDHKAGLDTLRSFAAVVEQADVLITLKGNH